LKISQAGLDRRLIPTQAALLPRAALEKARKREARWRPFRSPGGPPGRPADAKHARQKPPPETAADRDECAIFPTFRARGFA
jgi:hypothetical protein